MKLCVLDFDSTLIDGETLDILADAHGKGEEVKHITYRAMEGELDFFESLVNRVNLLKGLPYEKTIEVCQNLPLMPGAKETILALKQRGYKVVIFSGGFREATQHFSKVLGADADFANFLHTKNNVLTGQVGGEMMTGDAKGKLLRRLQKLLGICEEETMVVGDGANDLSMFQYSNKKIAFCAKEILKQAASHCVATKDLSKILEFA